VIVMSSEDFKALPGNPQRFLYALSPDTTLRVMNASFARPIRSTKSV